MNHLSAHELTIMFIALALLLAMAKLIGELAKKLGQPSVAGEIVAGILLGPTLLGRLDPHLYGTLFPSAGPVVLVIDAIATLSVVLFLLAAGLETSLHRIFHQGRRALLVSFFGGAIPFAAGFVAAYLFPELLGAEPSSHRYVFALFVATALSISALPVIAKTLMDLRLLHTDVGVIVISSAMFDDLVGWLLFGLVMGLVSANSTSGMAMRESAEILRTVLLVLGFVAVALTLGRWVIAKILRLIWKHRHGQGAALGFIFSLTLASAAFTEYAGIHAIFGAFIVAVAIGDALGEADPQRTATPTSQAFNAENPIVQNIRQVVTNVFAPFFFATIGLRTDFVSNFSLRITLAIVVVACAGKIFGASFGARLAGMDRRTSWAIGFGMNARGAMEIVLGMLALRANLIGERLFVALVIMALFTSLISGPTIQVLLRRSSAAAA